MYIVLELYVVDVSDRRFLKLILFLLVNSSYENLNIISIEMEILMWNKYKIAANNTSSQINRIEIQISLHLQKICIGSIDYWFSYILGATMALLV